MLKIAITGNIASGKTIVLDDFKDSGFKTLCLDEVVHGIYEEASFKRELLEYFGTIERAEIAKIVFKDKNKMKILEKIIYPPVIQKMSRFFDENLDEKMVFVGAPMVFEAGFDKYFDKIIFVSANENIRLKRLMKRNNFDEKEAKMRINSQMKEEPKIEKSDYVIKNEGTLEELHKKAMKALTGLNK